MKRLAICLLALAVLSSCGGSMEPNSAKEANTVKQNVREPMTDEEYQRIKENSIKHSDYEKANGYRKLVNHQTSKNIDKEQLSNYSIGDIEKFSYHKNEGSYNIYLVIDKNKNKLFFGLPTLETEETIPQEDFTPELLEELNQMITDSDLFGWAYVSTAETEPNVYSTRSEGWSIAMQFKDGTIVNFSGSLNGNPLDPNKNYYPEGYEMMHTYVKTLDPKYT